MRFKLFEDIRIVHGYNRTALLDLTREQILFIPSFFADELEQLNGTTNYKTRLKTRYSEMADELINFIENHEIGFECTEEEAAYFPPLQTHWDNASVITNAIVEIGAETPLSWIRKLENLGCKHLEMRVYDADRLLVLLDQLNDSIIKSITLIFETEPANITPIMNANLRVIEAHIFSTARKSDSTENNLFYHPESFENRPIVPQNTLNLTVNMDIYTESLKYNTYLNRKLFISKKGELKNSPETDEIWGFINDFPDAASLKKWLNDPKHQQLAQITKSEIDICSACEFKQSCVCNRIPQQRADQSWYYNEECAYNPYISKWSNEDDYQDLVTSGVICNAEGLTVDSAKIEEINEKIWN